MIYYVKGTLEELYADRAVIDCSGVGYMLTITSKTYDYLSDGAFRADGGSAGKQVKLYTHVRIADESRFETFGFAKKGRNGYTFRTRCRKSLRRNSR